MFRSPIRLVCFLVVFAVSCGLVVSGGGPVAGRQPVIIRPGQPVPPAPGNDGKDPKKDDKDGRPPEDDAIPFGFPYERDARNQLAAARDYLSFGQVPWGTVIPLLQNILDSRSDSFFNTYYTRPDGRKELLRISVKTEANRIISAFPKEGLEFYQQQYGQQASAALDDIIRGNYDLAALADLAQRYFHTKAGAEATVLMGTLYLERGNYLEAAYAFERLLGRPNAAEFLTPLTLYKACLAFKRSGDPRHEALLKTTLEELRKATLRNGLTLGRRTYDFDALKAEIDRPLELLRVTSSVGEWAMKGGNPARSATVDGGAPFLDPVFRVSMFYTGEDEANQWIRTELTRLFERTGKPPRSLPLPGFFPVSTSDLLVFRSYNGVYGVATRDQVAGGRVVRAGEVRWISKTTFGLHQMLTAGEVDDADMKRNVLDWWNTYTQGGAASVLYENPLIGALAHDGQNVYFVDDVAVPPPPVYANPEFGIMPGPQYRQSGELAEAVRAGRLVAVDLKTGRVVWELGRVRVFEGSPPLPPRLTEEEADRTTSAFELCLDAVFLGPPLPLNGKLYVLIEQAGVLRLVCLDPKNLVPVPGQTRKPALVWTQKLGRPNTALPQDSVRRFQGAMLAAGEGIIVCPTNSGAVVAVDILSRSLLWAHAYRRLEPNDRGRPPRIDPNTGRPITPEHLKPDRWRAGGPVIAGGRVILTAYDSDRLECLDLRTGRLLWWVPREANDLYCGGVVNDRVIVVGRNQVRGYHLYGEGPDQRPRVAFDPVPIPTPTGHGVGGKGLFYVPVRQDGAGRDAIPAAEIWAINVETGAVVSKTAARKRSDTGELARFGIGNLVFQDGLVFAQSAWEVACYPQLEQKKNEMNRLLAANPNDPVGLLARGELLLDDGKLKEAVADFKAALANNLPAEKRPLLREKLYVAYTELIRTDFTGNEHLLPEYEALCEVPIDGDLDPTEIQNRKNETIRRKRQYLYLVASGKESQGKLGEAFDKYLALANLGEGNLEDVPDEPNVRMRPDVWARGRIERMISRAADPAARRSLEDRVQREWDEVRQRPNDLKRLREFVAVFGPYFPVGAEAQFLLAEKLLQTNNEADARDAQTLLAQLRVSAEDPAVRARATEALARLMIQNRMMEDAVGLYLQLGRDYANVVVRDGKTGADFLTQLLTDKRLLPYLEPSRYPLPTRVKAEQTTPPAGTNFMIQFEVEPSGELFPAYKRYRFVFDQYVSGNGMWSLRAFDRLTGAEKARFTNLVALQIPNPGNIPFSRFVQASGQLLLVQLGSWVYCLDLATGKERWQRDLLDNRAAGGAPNPPLQEPGPDGDITVRYAEGYTITLGKAAVLQPGYVALLTRDGLEVCEPLTQRTLWTRRGIADRTQLYGDARYLVLVETGADRRPSSVRLLRATDGMPVEGSPDSGRVLAAARAFRILGRTALLVEGAGDQPRVLRLYDLATGQDLWRKDYPARSVPITPVHGDWTGFIRPDGIGEILDVRTGAVVTAVRIDERNLETDLAPCHEALLLADADRFYLFLEREPGRPSTNGTRRQPLYGYALRSVKVNGPLYAFDRTTGKRLWHYGNGLFENQQVILEQFADLPVIMASSLVVTPNGQMTCPVVVLEKERGRLIFDRAVVNNGNFFINLTVNLKAGTIELNRYDLRIAITPDDGPSKPANP